jgi:hypothetical protein
MDNKYDKAVPGKVRRKHRSRSKTQEAEKSDRRDRSLPPLPTLTEYRARRMASTSTLQEGPRENESQKISGTGSLNNFLKEAPPFMEKPSFE